MQPVLNWFRLDLRLDDNPALSAAAESRAPVIPFFIWAPEEEDPWPPGAASRVWLHHSLHSLAKALANIGSRLIIRRGPTEQALRDLLAETNARTIVWNRRCEPVVVERDRKLEEIFSHKGLEIRSFNSDLLFEPSTVLSSGGKPFQVFSPFWKSCLKQPNPGEPSQPPKYLKAPSNWPDSLRIAELDLEPKIDWAAGIRAAWTPGEAGAKRQLASFLNAKMEHYPSERNLPGKSGTSRLSPYLHFGEIGPRQIWHSLRKRRTPATAEAVDAYLRELGWREFARYLLFHFPFTTDNPFHKEFALFPWRVDRKLLKTWQCGKTGYPLVDAGMRELWATGWMHNRVRMVVGSFLTKHLRIRWQEGAYWFWDTLVDADLANNTLGWQWIAGCGADAVPYFRIFNPVLQGQKFDPEGSFIRRWVPELRGLPALWIHKPWTAPGSVLAEAGVQLGSSYPIPIVQHETARREILEAFEKIR